MIRTSRLKALLVKEFRQISRDAVMLRLIFVVPVIQITLFGFALNNETKHIKLAIFGGENDLIVQQFRQKALASGWFVEAKSHDPDPFTAVRSGRVEAALVLDADGLSPLANSETIHAQLLIDSVNALRASAVNAYARAILIDSITAHRNIKTPLPPIELTPRILYNPQLKTSFFLIPGLMGLMVCMITVLLTSMGFAREKEIGTMEVIFSAPISKTEIIIGKAIPFLLMGLFNMLTICIAAMVIFQMPFRGNFVLFLLAAVCFIITTAAIGIAISTISKTQQQAMMGSFLFMFPALLLSGLLFPIENMPDWMIVLTQINPLTHINVVMRNIVLKGGDWQFVLMRTLYLIIIGTAVSAIAYRNFKLTLN